MRKSALTLAVFVLSLALPCPAIAWHQDGHMAISRIAWKELTARQIIEITRILKTHPHYDVYLAADCPKGLSAAEWAFARASTWSDWVRDPYGPGLSAEDRAKIKMRYNKSVWHYIDLPYIHPNDVGKFDAEAIRKAILFPEFDDHGEPRHVLAALKQSMQLLQASDTSDEDKAVRICWLMHLVGDLHQPLHATGLMASKETFAPGFDPPGGDEGGNRLLVRAKASDSRTVKLHAYWDALLFGDRTPFANVDAVVAKLLKDPAYRRDQLPELKDTAFLAWAEESLELAKSVVYRGDGGFLKAYPLPKGKSANFQASDVPPLPDGYKEAAEAVAARRMVLAGYRLADQLILVCKAGER